MAKSANKRIGKPAHKLKAKWTVMMQENHKVINKLQQS